MGLWLIPADLNQGAPKEPGEAGVIGRDERAAVGRERQGVHLSEVPSQGQHLLTGDRVPQSDRAGGTG